MNREILFKGLRADGKGWVEGVPYFLNIIEDEPADCVHKACIIQWVDWDGTCGFMSPNNNAFVEVIPETVCQFTGLTDKNGVKVFENDICRWPSGNINKIIWTDSASFSAVDLDTNKNGRHGIVAKYIEVIGNIHDKLKS